MRAFGILAALSAITSVFAAPITGVETPDSVTALQGQDLTIVKAVVQLEVNLTPVLKTVHHVLDTVEDVVEEVEELVADLTPALIDLVHDVKGCALVIVGGIAPVVTNVLAPVTSLVGKTLEDVKYTLITVQKDVAVVAAVVMKRVGDKPDTFTTFQQSFDAFKTINAAAAKLTPGQETPSIKSAIGDAQYNALKQLGFNLD